MSKTSLHQLLCSHFRFTEEREIAKKILAATVKKRKSNQPQELLMEKLALKALNANKDGMSLLHKAVNQYHKPKNKKISENNLIKITEKQRQKLLAIIEEKVLAYYKDESPEEKKKIQQTAVGILLAVGKAIYGNNMTGKDLLEEAKRHINTYSRDGKNILLYFVGVKRKFWQKREQIKEETKQKIAQELDFFGKEKNFDQLSIDSLKNGFDEYLKQASKAKNVSKFLKKEVIKNGELRLSEYTRRLHKELEDVELDDTFYPNKNNLKQLFAETEIKKLLPLQKKILSADFIIHWIKKELLSLEEAKKLTEEQFENLRHDIINQMVDAGYFKVSLVKHYRISDDVSMEKISLIAILSSKTNIVELIECGKATPDMVFSLTKDEGIIFSERFIIDLIKNNVMSFEQAKQLNFMKTKALRVKEIQQFVKEGKLTVNDINTMTKEDYLSFFVKEAVNQMVIENFKKLQFDQDNDILQ